MAINIERRWCDVCQADVKAERHSVNHILHLLISLCTFGFWVIPWFLMAINRSYRCTVCGAKARVKTDPLTYAFIGVPIALLLFFSCLQDSHEGAMRRATAKPQGGNVVIGQAVIYSAPGVPFKPDSVAKEGQRLPSASRSQDGYSLFEGVEASGRKQTFWLRDADFESADTEESPDE